MGVGDGDQGDGNILPPIVHDKNIVSRKNDLGQIYEVPKHVPRDPEVRTKRHSLYDTPIGVTPSQANLCAGIRSW